MVLHPSMEWHRNLLPQSPSPYMSNVGLSIWKLFLVTDYLEMILSGASQKEPFPLKPQVPRGPVALT